MSNSKKMKQAIEYVLSMMEGGNAVYPYALGPDGEEQTIQEYLMEAIK